MAPIYKKGQCTNFIFQPSTLLSITTEQNIQKLETSFDFAIYIFAKNCGVWHRRKHYFKAEMPVTYMIFFILKNHVIHEFAKLGG